MPIMSKNLSLGVELEPGRSAADVLSRPDTVEYEQVGGGFPDSDNICSIFVEPASARGRDDVCGVDGAVGGGELGGEESCISTSATSCASLNSVASVVAADGKVAPERSASGMVTSWSKLPGGCFWYPW